MNRNAAISVVLGLLLVVGLAASCARQLYPGPSLSRLRTTTAMPGLQTTYSFVYADATSVQFLFWTETSNGALTGIADEVQDLSPGSPTFISSNLGWTGTRQGQNLTITIPGSTILATVGGTTLVRQQMDQRTGKLVNQLWVPGTIQSYNSLVEAFRAYTYLGQDLQGIQAELQSAQQFPSPTISTRVRSYLTDAQTQLAMLQSLTIPRLPGLVTPWVLSPPEINHTVTIAEEFLETTGPQKN
ncbi:MAG: hypothetical protein ACLQUY_25875 [Ktedonobacterales bacterium]